MKQNTHTSQLETDMKFLKDLFDITSLRFDEEDLQELFYGRDFEAANEANSGTTKKQVPSIKPDVKLDKHLDLVLMYFTWEAIECIKNPITNPP